MTDLGTVLDRIRRTEREMEAAWERQDGLVEAMRRADRSTASADDCDDADMMIDAHDRKKRVRDEVEAFIATHSTDEIREEARRIREETRRLTEAEGEQP